MCGLCGVLGAEMHWTDAAARPEALGGQTQPTRRQERFARIELANSAWQTWTVRDLRSRALRSATGRQELVPHLPGMWAAAERLAGRPCDPLDPVLIAAL